MNKRLIVSWVVVAALCIGTLPFLGLNCPTVGFRTLTLTPLPDANCGTVTAVPSSFYQDGTVVTITANPVAVYRFARWEGDAIGTPNPRTITIAGDMQISAVFEPIS